MPSNLDVEHVFYVEYTGVLGFSVPFEGSSAQLDSEVADIYDINCKVIHSLC